MQDILAISIVVVAAGFLIWRGWRNLAQRRAGACGACSNCPSEGASGTSQLITIAPIQSHAEAQSPHQ
jgi:hypothetical protein